MKICGCGASKWKSNLVNNIFECLKCYKKYTKAQLKKLKDKNEED